MKETRKIEVLIMVFGLISAAVLYLVFLFGATDAFAEVRLWGGQNVGQFPRDTNYTKHKNSDYFKEFMLGENGGLYDLEEAVVRGDITQEDFDEAKAKIKKGKFRKSILRKGQRIKFMSYKTGGEVKFNKPPIKYELSNEQPVWKVSLASGGEIAVHQDCYNVIVPETDNPPVTDRDLIRRTPQDKTSPDETTPPPAYYIPVYYNGTVVLYDGFLWPSLPLPPFLGEGRHHHNNGGGHQVVGKKGQKPFPGGGKVKPFPSGGKGQQPLPTAQRQIKSSGRGRNR
jgi:hypothetical protein